MTAPIRHDDSHAAPSPAELGASGAPPGAGHLGAPEEETGVNATDTLPGPLKLHDPPEVIARRIHEALAARGAHLPVRLWDGTQLGPGDAGYRLVVRRPWSLRALLDDPTDRGAGEAYIRDDIDVQGSMVDLQHQVARIRRQLTLGWPERAALWRMVRSLPAPPDRGGARRARLQGRLHSRRRDAQAVRFHYDVGNDFYRLVLDRRLVYSCAYFDDGDPADPDVDPTALDRAQVRKLDLICRKLRLRQGTRLLDIGCGWGALVLHAAERYGARAVGITLSEEQATLARERVVRAGLSDRVQIRLEDYRDTDGRFDAVASVGMFEHVGASRFATYFGRAAELTAPGGLFLHHAITTGRRQVVRELAKDQGSFVGAYVFPDGALAPAHVAVHLLEEAGLAPLDLHQLRPHYARTLRYWLANLEHNAEVARAEAGEAVYRIWRAYLAGSVVGFEDGDLGLIQLLGAHGQPPLPLRRGWMEPDDP